MIISRLDSKSCKDAFRLINCARLDLLQKNIDQWDELYPTDELIRDDIESGNAFGLFEDSKLVGYIVADETYASEYETIRWKHHCEKVLMLHRLCVNPAFHNRGFAKALIVHSEEWALLNAYGAIRLDVYENNKIIQYLVESLSYNYCGDIRLRKGIFRCYDKAIDPRA
jgi:GNAT superfamily N-acetyltransferase